MAIFNWNNHRRTFINSLPIQVALIGAVLTLSVSYYVFYSSNEKEKLQFESEVAVVERSVTETLQTYLALLNATRGYMYSHSNLDLTNFSQFVEELQLRDSYPGLQGIGYIKAVEAYEKSAVEAHLRSQGLTDYTIHPASPLRRYYPILYLEPLDQHNDLALGFDMYSQDVRRNAMEQARDTGTAILSGKVILIQEPEINRQPGFLFFLPLYQNDQTPKDVSDRQKNIAGYVYAPFRAGDFFTTVFETKGKPRINLTVYDGESEREENLLYQYDPDVDYSPSFTVRRTVYQGGRHPWTLVFRSKASLDLTSSRRFVPLFLASGSAITLLLYLVSRSLLLARLQAELFQMQLMKSQLALQSSEERMRLVVEGLKDLAIITLNTTGAVTSWNPGADRFFGYTERQILDKQYAVFFTPRERRANKPTRDMNHVIEAGTLEFERMMIRKNGTRFWASGLMSALYDSVGELHGVAMIVQDVSNRKRSEVQLRKQESVTQAVMSSLPALIAVLDHTGTIVSTNSSWSTFMSQLPVVRGKNQNQVGDNYIRQLEKQKTQTNIEYSQQAAEGIRKVLHGESAEFVLEYPFAFHNEELWFLLTATALKHEEGGVVVSNTNITTLKKLDQQRNEFLSIASHELKTPITSARAYVQVLQRLLEVQKNERVGSIINKVLSQVDKMQLLIGDLLDTSKIEAGKLRLSKQAFSLDALVFEIAESMQLITDTHTIRLKGVSEAMIFADRDRIGQVITNLIDNAIKYSPNASSVEIERSVQKDEVTVTVSDFGLGIAKKDLKHLFQRFYRAQQVSTGVVYPGLGLGLYICAEIIHRSGGVLSVQSEQGKGSAFSFTLPVLRSES